jgi:NAD(P)-dependent dehydrogenase (short-subunit alcohol dehydrogenase family)
MDDEHWFPVIETHLLGGFYLARAAWPAMVDAGLRTLRDHLVGYRHVGSCRRRQLRRR